MFNFDEPRYEKVVSDALALRPQIEAAVDEVCEQGYSNSSSSAAAAHGPTRSR